MYGIPGVIDSLTMTRNSFDRDVCVYDPWA